jgi:DNA-directed RNA polymerase specialized sigma24 family protein
LESIEGRVRSTATQPTYTQRLSRSIDEAYDRYQASRPEGESHLYRAFNAQAANITSWWGLWGDEALPHDITVRAMSKLWQFRGESRVSTWFFRIARRETHRAWSRRNDDLSRFVPLEPAEEGYEVTHTSSVPSRNTDLDVALDLERLMSCLAKEQSDVFRLCAQGLTLSEVAAELRSPLGTTRSRYRLGKEALRRFVRPESDMKGHPGRSNARQRIHSSNAPDVRPLVSL